MGDGIDDLTEEIIVDAHDEHEQLWSLSQVFEDEARFPFRGRVVGVEVEVTAVDFDGDTTNAVAWSSGGPQSRWRTSATPSMTL